MIANIQKIKIAFLFFYVLNLPSASTQSFIKEVSTVGSVDPWGATFSLDDKDRISILRMGSLFQSGPTGVYQFSIINLDKIGVFTSGLSFQLDSVSPFAPGNIFSFKSKSEYRLFSFANLGGDNAGIVCANIENNTYWTRKTKKSAFSKIAFAFATDKNKVIAATRPYSDSDLNFEHIFGYTGLAEFDLKTGEPGWSYTYHYKTPSNPYGFSDVREIVELPDGNIILSVYVIDSADVNMKIPGILKISKEGEVLDDIIFDSLAQLTVDQYSFNSAGIDVDRAGNIFVSGRIKNRSEWNIDNQQEGFIAKFDSDFNLIWAKRLHAENFSPTGIPIKISPTGDIIFAYYTLGEIPVILGQIDTNGELLWSEGYAFFSPQLEIDSDGSFLFLSAEKFLSNGTTEPGLMIGKADPNGDMGNCPQFTSCVSLFDLDLPCSSSQWFHLPADTLPELSFSVSQFTGSTEDYCETPEVPDAFFELPDTVCQNQCLSPDSLNNNLAHAVRWNIHTDSLIFQSEDRSFNYCFNNPGTYQIEQEVWLLGCSEFFTRNLVVLSDSLGDLLGEDRMICNETAHTLSPSTVRPVNDFHWNDGSENSHINIVTSGIYEVTVSDGFCTAEDSVEITFFDEWLTGTDLFLPEDIYLCADSLPYILKPQSDFTGEFFITGKEVPQTEFSIFEQGNYRVTANIADCEITEDFNLKVTPCEVDIYIPSSFSPNNDGINDFLEPFGNDFLGKKIEIYDRWGGKIFETESAPFLWNGEAAGQGVYVVLFSYYNLRNQQSEMISSDVLLIR